MLLYIGDLRLAEPIASSASPQHPNLPAPNEAPLIPTSTGSTRSLNAKMLICAREMFVRIRNFFHQDLIQRDVPPVKVMHKKDSLGPSKVDEVMEKLQFQTGNYTKFTEIVESSMLVNIHDVSGQPGFLEMIPSLIGGPAAYILSSSICQNLWTSDT